MIISTKELGNIGENLACEYLVKNKYKILGRNCVYSVGEIDIIAKKRGLFADKTVHFVEVKTLSSAENFYPEERVDYEKQNKYKRLAEIWLEKNKFSQNHPYQIDIAAVTIYTNENPKIDYFENIVSGR